MNFNNKRVGVIGAGAMGSAMIRGFLKAGLMQPQDMIASDLRDNALQELKRSTSINITSDNSAVVQRSQVIIFAVKPDQVENTLKEVASSITVEHLVVSVAAGISISTFEKHLPSGVPVIRVMPNVPALIGEGMTALALGSKAGKDDQETAEALFSALGKVLTVQESELDAVTGMSGCGPCITCCFITGAVHKCYIRVLLGHTDRGVHKTETGCKNNLVALFNQLSDRLFGVIVTDTF
jgi:pyrroline-5-carboxylate reductase